MSSLAISSNDHTEMVKNSQGHLGPGAIRDSICAVIVTFRPKLETLENIRHLRPQVPGLVVVDNGSPAECIDSLNSAAENLNFSMIPLGSNLGIATALNEGVKWARSQGYKWVVLFDQDSRVVPDFMNIICDCYQAAPSREDIAIISGRYKDPDGDEDADISSVITSGSVIPTQVFERCGLFEEPLFIDCVDDEFCLRTSQAGYRFVLTGKRALLHSLGEPTRKSFLGMEFTTANYGARRRYYRNRNRVRLVLRYWWKRPRWCKNTIIMIVKEFLKILAGEDNKLAKVRYTFLGFFHGIIGKMGKVVEL